MGFDEKIIILATSERQAADMRADAEGDGIEVKSTTVWEGPVPPNSYMFVAPFIRMSTPEYYLFRKCNTLDRWEAVVLAAEMFSHYATWKTCHNEEFGHIERLDEPRTTPRHMAAYLRPVADTPEAMVAADVVREAADMVECFEQILGTMTKA